MADERELSKLVRRWGYLTGSEKRKRYIAALICGYGASLLKSSGATLDETLAVIREKWDGLAGGTGTEN